MVSGGIKLASVNEENDKGAEINGPYTKERR